MTQQQYDDWYQTIRRALAVDVMDAVDRARAGAADAPDAREATPKAPTFDDIFAARAWWRDYCTRTFRGV